MPVLYRWVRHTVNGNMFNQSVTNAGIEALGQLKTDEKKHKKGKSGYEGTEDDNWPQGKFWEQTNISFLELQLCQKYIITATLFDTEIGAASQSSWSIIFVNMKMKTIMTKKSVFNVIVIVITIERGAVTKPSLVVVFQLGPCYYMLSGHSRCIFAWWWGWFLLIVMMMLMMFSHDHDDGSGVPAHCLGLRLPPSVTTLLFNIKMDTAHQDQQCCENDINVL